MGLYLSAGIVLAVTLTLFSSWEGISARAVADRAVWRTLGVHLLTNCAGLAAVMAVIALPQAVLPHRYFGTSTSFRTLAVGVGTYALAGIAGAWARYGSRLALGVAFDVPFPFEIVTTMAAGVLCFTTLGVLASQFAPVIELVEQARALAWLSRQTAAIAGRRDFGQRLAGAERGDEVGRFARTVNDLLETVDVTLRSHREFVADASHELRNPLTAIQVNLDLLAASTEETDTAAREECLRQAAQQVKRMRRLVSDLLLLARLDAGLIVQLGRVSIRQVVMEEVAAARSRAAGQEVVADVEDVTVIGDADRLGEVVANLLTNALQHTAAGGRILARVRREKDACRIDVEDEGQGIAPEHLAHVFERFYRVERRARDGEGGTGLGLAIVRHLVQAHGGRVEVASEVGVGSRFSVWVPVAG